MDEIIIRPFRISDTPALVTLFREAVHAIASRHYTPEQLAVWAPATIKAEDARWQSMANNIAYVAELNSIIVGFADMTHEGYLDRLYVHKDYQARWISYRLFKQLEQKARELGLAKMTTHCSITAKKPAERMGFIVIKEQTVMRNGVALVNYVMEKVLV